MSKHSNQTFSKYRSITLPISVKQSLLPKQFSVPQKVGAGLTAQVYRCKHTQFGDVCVKIINNTFTKTALGDKLIKNQITILEKLSHNNILKIYKTLKFNQHKIIVTQFCSGGDLQKEIKNKKKINEKDALQIFSQIASGCKYLLQQNIIHRDIKPSNILLKFKGKHAIIADFGFAVEQSDKQLMKKNVGSPLYMAPEALSDLNFTDKSEVFSLGVLLYQMITGKTPWNAVSQRDLLNKMKATKPAQPQNISRNTWNSLLKKCLQIDPSKRPNFKDIEKTVKQILQGLNENYGRLNSYNKNESFNYNELSTQNIDESNKQNCSKYKKNNLTQYLPKIYNKNKTTKQNIIERLSVSSRKQRDSLLAHQKLKTNTFKKIHTKTQSKVQEKKEQKQFSAAQIVQKINPRCYQFLPESLILKFEFIIKKYIFIAKINSKDKQNFKNKPKPHQQIERDLMIIQIQKCESQKALCQIIVGFIRRLLRLTKNYLNLNSKNNAGQYLDLFYQKVSQISN